MPKEYYQILGIDESASQEQIKKAYRQKALLLHPDVNPSEDALLEFQLLSEAYEVLSDPIARMNYDSDEVFVPLPDETVYETPQQHYSQEYSDYEYQEPLDYNQFRTGTTFFGALILIFTLSFLLDFFSHNIYEHEKIEGIRWQKANKETPQNAKMLVKTTHLNFTITNDSDWITSHQFIDVKQSWIYKNTYIKSAKAKTFIRVSGITPLMYGLAFVTALLALGAIFLKERPERKFNCALIGAFLSILLILIVKFA